MLGETHLGDSRFRLKEASGPLGEVYGSLGTWPSCLSQNYSRILAGDEASFE